MYERLLNKNEPPSEANIEEYIGKDAYALLLSFDGFMRGNYHIGRELKFPFGHHYGWAYKYSHKTSHLCYVFFESGAFTVTLQLSDNLVSQVNNILPSLSHKTHDLWQNRYICGTQGGWLHYRVLDVDELNDIVALVKIRRKPSPRKLMGC